MNKLPKITISPQALDYLDQLLKKESSDIIGIKIFVVKPGTPIAEVCLSYHEKKDWNEKDLVIDVKKFKIYLEAQNIKYLENANIQYKSDNLDGGILTINAPNSIMKEINEDSSLSDKINYLLYTEINPQLSEHGGRVDLIKITQDNYVILEFSGGCQGCSAIDITLKQGIEKRIKEYTPVIKGIKDITDHDNKENAFYK